MLTCTLTGDSPVPATFKVGDQVGIACVDGVLVKIVRLPQPAGSNDGSGKDGTTTTPSVNLYATGSITALTDGAIAIHGDRDTSCTRGPSSPKLGDYKLGDRVRIACTNGVLTGIARAESSPPPPPPPPPAPPTTTPTVNTYATGSITALTDGAIAIHGDHDTTCTRGPSSPTLGDYKVGDKVTIACVNGVLAGIAKSSSPPAASAPASSRADGRRLLRRARSRRSRTARSASTATTTRPARAARPRRSSATTRSATG